MMSPNPHQRGSTLACKVAALYSENLRDEANSDALHGNLVGVVRETMQPAHVSPWLRPDTASRDQQTN